MLQITSPVCVLGDIHGSFDDLQFFLTQLYDADGPEPSPPGDTRSEREHQLATHVLVLRDDGDHEVSGGQRVVSAEPCRSLPHACWRPLLCALGVQVLLWGSQGLTCERRGGGGGYRAPESTWFVGGIGGWGTGSMQLTFPSSTQGSL